MIISRQLRIALLISFFWHLFWISSVSIVNPTAGLKPRQYSAVIFLGSILNSRVSLRDPQKGFIELPATAALQRKTYFKKKPYTLLHFKKKALAADAFIDVDAPKEKTPFFGRGPILTQEQRRKRQILFRPSFPEYPEWQYYQLKGSYAVFEVCVLGDGLVGQVINVKTCGNPEIDAVLVRYLRKWRFVPSSNQKEQWQKIKLTLEINPEQSREIK